MHVHLEPHNPAWFEEFARTKSNLEQALSGVPVVAIEHVGSTSIPGLLAKPIIDIDIICKREDMGIVRKAMIEAGYSDRGDLGIPGRIAFVQPEASSVEMRRNTYAVVEGSLCLKNHLDLKRMILQDAGLKQEYAEIKLAMAHKEVPDVDAYCTGKNAVVLKILRAAGWTDQELEEVKRANDTRDHIAHDRLIPTQ
ncbi:hypothetical protein PVAG01_02480 [Phlyctema vagabunda]|uniref:GrpB family protein n=1 Tax=Phlyctema vagabunda TaxID=108571 RepID=A0ABR4PQU4_9HELO